MLLAKNKPKKKKIETRTQRHKKCGDKGRRQRTQKSVGKAQKTEQLFPPIKVLAKRPTWQLYLNPDSHSHLYL